MFSTLSTWGQNPDISLYLLQFGVVLTLSAYLGLLSIQSSVNISESLGVISVGVLKSSSVWMCLFMSSFVLLRFGVKACLVAGEFSFAIFTISNFYPSYITLIPAAVVGGFGSTIVWSSMGVYTTKAVADMWSKRNKNEYSNLTEDKLRNKYFGSGFKTIKLSLIIGNVVSFSTLYGGSFIGAGESFLNITNVSNCGVLENRKDINDYSNYIPSNHISVYVLLSVYTFMQLSAVLLHVIYLTNYHDRIEKDSESIVSHIKSSLMETLYAMTTPLNSLLAPLMFYYGLSYSFALNDFTKEFVSCTMGVERVGLLMGLYGIGSATGAFMIGRINSKYDMALGCGVAVLVETSAWVGLLLWRPGETSTNYIYVCAIVMGAGNGICQTVTMSNVPIFFKGSEEIGFSIKSLHTALGMAIGFTCSNLLFIRTKLIILLITMLMSYTFLLVADYIRRRRSLTDAKDCETKRILGAEE